MQIELKKEDCINVQIALINFAKASHTSVDEMKVALMLSEKFVFKEEAAITPKEEHVDGNPTISEGKTSNKSK